MKLKAYLTTTVLPAAWRSARLTAGAGLIALASMGPVSAQEETNAAANSGPRPYQSTQLSESDTSLLNSAIASVQSRNFAQAESLRLQMTSPVARKIVLWTAINNDSPVYSFAALDAARRDLWGWPRESKRQIAAERLITGSGMTSQQIVEWFAGSPPQSFEGAVSLISALSATGKDAEAQTLAKSWWRTQIFEAGQQANFRQAYGRYLTADDHLARLNCLLLNPTSGSASAIRDLMPLVDGNATAVAEAVLAMRTLAKSSDSLYTAALSRDPNNKVLAFERVRYLERKGLETLAYPLLGNLPPASMSPDAAKTLYTLRVDFFKSALKAQDYRTAYNAMAGGGFNGGEYQAEAEFFAGWLALVRFNDPVLATRHFEGVAAAGTSPITQGRANYWLGRAWEARGDQAKAQAHYAQGGQYIYAFYGQLAAEKAGVTTLKIGNDPVPSQADRDRFENRDMVQAARLLGGMGQTDMFRVLVLHINTILPNAEEEALLFDLVAYYDTQMTAMKIARVSMQRGFYLPERAYPLRSIPNVRGPEPAFVLAITRQESGFDPSVRSHANARGMMQLLPSTARGVARRMSVSYTESKLYEPEFNMSLGAYHLGELVDQFGGSYVMAAAGYNAGPSRMGTWVGTCGDPRGAAADPLSFIECHPFTETRNYMMRVVENTRVYRARLNGGSAPLTAMADVQRGSRGAINVTPDDEETASGGQGPIPYTAYRSNED